MHELLVQVALYELQDNATFLDSSQIYTRKSYAMLRAVKLRNGKNHQYEYSRIGSCPKSEEEMGIG